MKGFIDHCVLTKYICQDEYLCICFYFHFLPCSLSVCGIAHGPTELVS